MKNWLKQIYDYMLYYCPHQITHSVVYKRFHEKKMDWKNPKTFDEKIHWLIAKKYGKEEAYYADKLKVREYVKECGCESLLTQIYGVWDHVSEIDVDRLPDKFVLKTNNASGGEYYIICKEKQNIDWEKELPVLEKGLRYNFARKLFEYHYAYIEPKIFAEEFLDDGHEKISDYKVFCFDGEPKFILVCSDRDAGRDLFDLDWNHLEFNKKEVQYQGAIDRPLGLSAMIEASKKLSKPFCFARLDFYDVNGKIYFGEITLSPAAGNMTYLNPEGQLALGECISLPKE